MSAHTCHAIGCAVEVRPELLFCRAHWHRLPVALRSRVLMTYRPGQCQDWQPSAAYCDAAREAVETVARLEGRAVTGREPELEMYEMFKRSAEAR